MPVDVSVAGPGILPLIYQGPDQGNFPVLSKSLFIEKNGGGGVAVIRSGGLKSKVHIW